MVIFLIGCSQPVAENPAVAEFASCLTSSGVTMYGSITCSACAQQKELFGASFRHVVEIECNPHQPGNQAEFCLEQSIERTPTWILEQDGQEVSRVIGFQSFATLSEFSGCAEP